VYREVWGGGGGIAGIGGGLDHLWYCRTFLAGFGGLSVLSDMIEQVTGRNTRLYNDGCTASRREGRGEEQRESPRSELYIITIG
jgi:hypothetical protein